MIRSRNKLLVAITWAVLLSAPPRGVSAQTPQATPTSSAKAAADSVAASNDKDVLRAVEQVRDDVRALRHEVDNLRALLETARGKSGSNALPERIALAGAGPKEPLLTNGVYFFNADWSGPCQTMRPLVDRFKREGLPIVDVDVDRRRDLRREFHINTIPACVLMIGGKEKRRSTGLLTEAQLRRIFAMIPPSPSTSAPSKPGLKAASNAKTESKTVPSIGAAVPPASTAHHDSPRGAADNTAEYELRSYRVAELVLPMPGKPKTTVDENFEKLKGLLTATIEPASWHSAGGPARILQSDKTLSLIIYQKPAVHRQVLAFLRNLGALQDWQVCLELRLVEPATPGLLESVGLANPLPRNQNVLSLSDEQRTKFLEASQRDTVANFYASNVTMFYGTRGSIAPVANGSESLDLEVPDSTDRYAVNLRFGLHDNKTGKVTTEPVTVNIPNLKTIVIDLKRIGEGPSPKRSLLVVRPRLLFPLQEEVEQEAPNNAATQSIEPSK